MPLGTISSVLGLHVVLGHSSTLWPILGLSVSVFFILGWGILCAKKLEPTMELTWDVVLLCGMGVWGLLTFGMLSLEWWNPWVVGVLLLLGGAGWIQGRCIVPKLSEVTWFAVVCLAFLTGFDVLGPMIDTDALYYHQALAKQMSLRSSLVGGWFEPNGSRPMLLHSAYASMWLFLGEKGPSLIHWLLSMGLVVSVLERSRGGIWGFLLLVSSWSFVQEIGVLSNNLPTAFAVFLTWRMVCSKHFGAAALLAFIALSYKLTSLGLIAGIWLVYVSGFRHRLQLMGFVCALFSIWVVRNIGSDLSPLFPFSGWDEPFQSVEKYGMGRLWEDFLLLPWNVFVHAEIDTHLFQGRLSPMLLVGLLVVQKLDYRGILFFLLGCVFWAAGPQWLRHAMLLVPIWVFLLGPHIHTKGIRILLFAGLFLGVDPNWGPLLSRWSASWEVMRGVVTEESFLKEKIVGYQALKWVDQKLPSDSCPALLFVWSGAVLNRPYVLSSVEDHIPVRAWLRKYGEEAFDVLECDHLVVGNPAMSRKKYSFLSDEVYQKQILVPLEQLEEQLLKQAVMVYTAKGVRVYRIEK